MLLIIIFLRICGDKVVEVADGGKDNSLMVKNIMDKESMVKEKSMRVNMVRESMLKEGMPKVNTEGI